MAAARFDLHRLFSTVDAERLRRGLSWSAVADQVGVAPSTIRRFERADDAEADGVLALVRWLGVAPEQFVTPAPVGSDLLDPPGEGYVRVDMAQVAEAAGEPDGPMGRTRTTVQRLVAVAGQAGRPVASLTRLSEF